MSERCIEQVNPFCSIVERDEMLVVGVQVDLAPHSVWTAITAAQYYIHNGTCRLLEDLLGPRTSGEYVAVVSAVKTGIEFTYCIGVQVESLENLPPYLPSNTVSLRVPAMRYAKVTRSTLAQDPHPDPKQAICYLSSAEFRHGSGYCYDLTGLPFRVFDATGEMRAAYEPIKRPQSPEEAFEQVNYEIVHLPEIRVVGCTGEGLDCMFRLFEIENSLDWQAMGCLNTHQYYSFTVKDAQGKILDLFGRLVQDFSRVPDSLARGVIPSGLWVRFTQKQINNDDPAIIFEGAKEMLFTRRHPEFEDDETRCGLYVGQYEQGACFYFPIRLKA